MSAGGWLDLALVVVLAVIVALLAWDLTMQFSIRRADRARARQQVMNRHPSVITAALQLPPGQITNTTTALRDLEWRAGGSDSGTEAASGPTLDGVFERLRRVDQLVNEAVELVRGDTAGDAGGFWKGWERAEALRELVSRAGYQTSRLPVTALEFVDALRQLGYRLGEVDHGVGEGEDLDLQLADGVSRRAVLDHAHGDQPASARGGVLLDVAADGRGAADVDAHGASPSVGPVGAAHPGSVVGAVDARTSAAGVPTVGDPADAPAAADAAVEPGSAGGPVGDGAEVTSSPTGADPDALLADLVTQLVAALADRWGVQPHEIGVAHLKTLRGDEDGPPSDALLRVDLEPDDMASQVERHVLRLGALGSTSGGAL